MYAYLLTSVAHGAMADVSASIAKNVGQASEGRLLRRALEDMTGMVAMLVADMAVQAEVIVIAGSASDEFLLRKYYQSQYQPMHALGQPLTLDTGVAGPRRLFGLKDYRLALFGEGAGHFLLGVHLWLRTNLFCRAVDDDSVPDKALHHPVVYTRAMDTGSHACSAQVVIATVTGTAVEMLILHGLAAVIAEDDP